MNTVRSAWFLPAWSLLTREMIRFCRQRSRVMGALLTPLVFWIILGSGFGRSFQTQGSDGYLEYFFPGTLAMVLLFTAIYSTISIIEDRTAGFLQGVLVAPVSRTTIVVGKSMGPALLATLQGMLYLIVAPFAGIPISALSIILALPVFLLVSLCLTSMGFIMAWRMKSIQGFHAIMNLLLLPMWIMSGAAFPASQAAGVLKIFMLLNPLTYGVALIRHVLYLGRSTSPGEIPSVMTSLTVLSVALVLLMAMSVWFARKPEKGTE